MCARNANKPKKNNTTKIIRIENSMKMCAVANVYANFGISRRSLICELNFNWQVCYLDISTDVLQRETVRHLHYLDVRRAGNWDQMTSLPTFDCSDLTDSEICLALKTRSCCWIHNELEIESTNYQIFVLIVFSLFSWSSLFSISKHSSIPHPFRLLILKWWWT